MPAVTVPREIFEELTIIARSPTASSFMLNPSLFSNRYEAAAVTPPPFPLTVQFIRFCLAICGQSSGLEDDARRIFHLRHPPSRSNVPHLLPAILLKPRSHPRRTLLTLMSSRRCPLHRGTRKTIRLNDRGNGAVRCLS